MPPIPPDKMTDAQKKAVADYKTLRGVDLTGPPWTVLLRVPAHVVPALQIRLHYLNKQRAAARLTELAILIAARRWTNNWEWNAHSTAAATAGLKARRHGRRRRRPASRSHGGRRGARVRLQPRAAGQPERQRRDVRAGRRKFGEPGVVELASIQGYYAYLAMVMNVARMTTQPGTASPLERFPSWGRAMASGNEFRSADFSRTLHELSRQREVDEGQSRRS